MSQTWFITGTSSGFGRNLTEVLLERGDRVAATLRTPSALDDLAGKYGDNLWIRTLDVTDTDALRSTVSEAFAELSRIDVVVSNAGYGLFGAAEELEDSEIIRQLDTNVVASIQLARAVVPFLRTQGGGKIVQLSSLGGQAAFPGMSLYHASKWAIEGFYEAFGPEVAGFGIQTILVEPGMARTAFGGASAAISATDTSYDGRVLRAGSMTLAQTPGDPRKMAQAMVAAADQEHSPSRLLLGSDAYAMVGAALTARLESVEAQKATAFSTDADDYVIGSRTPWCHGGLLARRTVREKEVSLCC